MKFYLAENFIKEKHQFHFNLQKMVLQLHYRRTVAMIIRQKNCGVKSGG